MSSLTSPVTTAAEILREFQPMGILSECIGDPDTRITGISPAEAGKPGDLVFIDKKEYLPHISANRPSVVIAPPALKAPLSEIGVTVLIAPQVPLAHAMIKSRYADRDYDRSGWNGIHPSAVVHESARIDKSVIIEPRAVIGARAEIGPDCRIMAGAVIENDAVIGAGTVIHPSVVVGYACRIGRDVEVAAGTVIGSEGYGFAQDKQRKSHRIPQTGIVVIEDRVRIGSNCSIDRATYNETRIGAGTKIDNLCHIAHNVQIGEDCLLTAMLCVAGSTKIGKRVITSGQTGILDHMNICDDVVLLHRAGVTKDLETPGAYAGLPLQPLGEYMKNQAVLKNAVELRKRIGDLEKGERSAE